MVPNVPIQSRIHIAKNHTVSACITFQVFLLLFIYLILNWEQIPTVTDIFASWNPEFCHGTSPTRPDNTKASQENLPIINNNNISTNQAAFCV